MRCLVAMYAYLDIEGVEDFAGLPAGLRREVSPVHQLAAHAADMPPMLIARAGRDDIPQLAESIDRFVAEALDRNAPVTLVNHPAAPHGFDNQLDDPRSREILRQVLELLRVHLGVAGGEP